MTRRTIIAAGAGEAASSTSGAAGQEIAYAPRPLPFAPGSIAGFSQRLLTSHHDNNYAGAVKRLGAIQMQLAARDLAVEPGFLLNGLKREELIALNSMILHEVYFASFAGSASPGKALSTQIELDFGSVERWRSEFAAIGRALGGGSGWVLLTFSPRAGRLLNGWSADHSMTAADGPALIALDMYEHAYALDYGADAPAYVDAFMSALRWDQADAAFKKAA
ncbi:MAG: Fe-Mn family superoxide dismutase [Parvularculaceae bacterium]